MSLYCKVQNGLVVEGPTTLPPDLFLQNLPKETLLAQGWYELVVNAPIEYDERVSSSSYNFSLYSDHVELNYEVTPLSNNEIITKLAEFKATLKNEVTGKRYDIEVGGVTIGGTVIKTDRESQSTVNGALNFLQINQAAVIDWKGANGWTTINYYQIMYIANIVGAHVQACFSREKVLHGIIDACTTLAELDAIDINTGWPGN